MPHFITLIGFPSNIQKPIPLLLATWKKSHLTKMCAFLNHLRGQIIKESKPMSASFGHVKKMPLDRNAQFFSAISQRKGNSLRIQVVIQSCPWPGNLSFLCYAKFHNSHWFPFKYSKTDSASSGHVKKVWLDRNVRFYKPSKRTNYQRVQIHIR